MFWHQAKNTVARLEFDTAIIIALIFLIYNE